MNISYFQNNYPEIAFYVLNNYPEIAFYVLNWWENDLQNYNNKFEETLFKEKRKKVIFVEYHRLDSLLKLPQKNFSLANLIIAYTDEWGLDSSDKLTILDITSQVKKFFNNNNVIFVNGGRFYNLDQDLKEIISPPYLLDFTRTFRANQHLYEYYKNIHEPNYKDYVFDCLLGAGRPHRIKLYNALNVENLLNKSLFSIRSKYFIEESKKLFKLEDERIQSHKSNKNWYSSSILANENFPMSALISPKIYEHSWFSVVAETLFKYKGINKNYATEKTAKCFFAKRIFVCFALPNHLEFLKILGFKTFGDIIDESYDLEYNNNKRFEMAFEQIIWLSKQNPKQLYDKAKPILDHNFKVINQNNFNYIDIINFVQYHIDKL